MDAAERGLVYYRRTGWSGAGCLLDLGAALLHGPTPAPAGLARCEQLLEEATDRLGTAYVLVYLGGMHAMGERYDEALALLADADRIFDELGEVHTQADHSGRVRGSVHLLAGDPELAEATFAATCATLERFHDEPGLSSVAAMLGNALYLQERFEEARRWSRVARERGPVGDRISQISWRSLEAKLLAEKGAISEAEELVNEALRMVALTDALTSHGNVLLDAATVDCAARKYAEASRKIEEARALFDAKENAASGRLAESRLAEVAFA
jgi:tetratricopeptide (TPR) repeat protein